MLLRGQYIVKMYIVKMYTVCSIDVCLLLSRLETNKTDVYIALVYLSFLSESCSYFDEPNSENSDLRYKI